MLNFPVYDYNMLLKGLCFTILQGKKKFLQVRKLIRFNRTWTIYFDDASVKITIFEAERKKKKTKGGQ